MIIYLRDSSEILEATSIRFKQAGSAWQGEYYLYLGLPKDEISGPVKVLMTQRFAKSELSSVMRYIANAINKKKGVCEISLEHLRNLLDKP